MRRFASTSLVLSTLVLVALTVVATQSTQAQAFTVIHNFTGGQDGGNPNAGLTLDKAGNLYGTADIGGVGDGTVYQLKHKGSGWVFTPLSTFKGGGANPLARVVFGPNGALYGTTEFGELGDGGFGTVFNLRPLPTACKTALCSWTETMLYQFTGGSDGGNPAYGDLTFDQTGNIYGTTYNGGTPHAMGVVYELTPSGGGWTQSVLYSFSGSDGGLPANGVIFDHAGNLYGTTTGGGSGNSGTVFALTPSGSGWTESLLYSFQNGSDGGVPYAGLIFDRSGNLYGATSDGGSGSGGTVFELLPSGGSWTYSLLYSFTGGSKCGPWGSLVMDGLGNLYGTTACDGANNAGNVFKLTPSGGSWTYTSLQDFTGGSDGGTPYCNVVFDTSGNLYGTTFAGGSHGFGVVWEITP